MIKKTKITIDTLKKKLDSKTFKIIESQMLENYLLREKIDLYKIISSIEFIIIVFLLLWRIK